MLVYIKSSKNAKLPEGVRRTAIVLNNRLKANAITFDEYADQARKLKAKVPTSKWDVVSNMLMVSL